MTAKRLTMGALCWTLFMMVAVIGTLFIQRDTAMHEQGPLNPHNLDSVRWMAKGAADVLVPTLLGLSVTTAMLAFAVIKGFSTEASQ